MSNDKYLLELTECEAAHLDKLLHDTIFDTTRFHPMSTKSFICIHKALADVLYFLGTPVPGGYPE